jgi:WXG100 family type VII secretion target
VSDAYRVSLPALLGVVDRLAAFDRTLAAKLAHVEATLRTVAAIWDGTAEATYELAQRRWDRDLDELRAAVTRMHTAAATAHGNYSSAVAANAAMWNR